MTPHATAPAPSRPLREAGAPLPRLAQDVLQVLYRHRMLTTRQLAILLTPHTTTTRYLRRILSTLRARGLAAGVERRFAPGGRDLISYLTPAGAHAVENTGQHSPRRRRPPEAGGALDAHTLAVVEAGVAMVTWARVLGHECGPLSWRPEVHHRLGPDPTGGERLIISDAVLHYTETSPHRRLHTWFIELDRGTEPVAVLAAKLAAYGRYAQYVPAPPPGPRARTRSTTSTRPAWTSRYPRLPHLLLVLCDLTDLRAHRRIADVRALVANNPSLAATGGQLAPVACTLDTLRDQGPAAPIATPLLAPDAAPRPLIDTDADRKKTA